MQRVKEALAAADKKTDIPISAAMGYAWSDDPDKDTEKLLQSADAFCKNVFEYDIVKIKQV